MRGRATPCAAPALPPAPGPGDGGPAAPTGGSYPTSRATTSWRPPFSSSTSPRQSAKLLIIGESLNEKRNASSVSDAFACS